MDFICGSTPIYFSFYSTPKPSNINTQSTCFV